MKLSSLFKHKAYSFGHPNETRQDCLFAIKIIVEMKDRFKI